ncbi:MAG: tetratricopeptide repeat protein [Nocardioides sp.]
MAQHPAQSPAPPAQRAIRVFVSSTFRDMQPEREELVKRVFPQVRRLCEQRGVAWSEVDLRWGVSDEQKAEGAVLPICLAEIDRSRPYFLGLLGQRYGWVPEELPGGLADRLPWLGDLPGTSVTELEVLHGVLNHPEAQGYAFFHLRDPLPTDVPDESPDQQRRLAELKDRVRASAHPCAGYADPAQLGRQVLAELTALVDRLFPVGATPDAAGRDAAAHAAYGLARAAGGIERESVTSQFGHHVVGALAPLVVRGEPGADLTPLVATWVDRWRAEHPDDLVVQHHVGATSESADWHHLAARIVAAVSGAEEAPADAAARRASLFAAIESAGADERRLLLVVDGADLLADHDGAPDLTWLPPTLPANVRVLVTTTGPRPVDEALRRGWTVVDVDPLTEAERADYVRSFLARWSKRLDLVHVETLARSPHTGSVLYLRTVLDELRQHGDHFTLRDVIAGYLSCATVDDLLEMVLARYEHDFERDRPDLVGDAFRALWAARRGLTEPELLDLLGDGADPLSHATWSPLVLAAEAGLITRSGLLGFATDEHRTAVKDRYLGTDDARREAHRRVGAYFARQPIGPRVVEELPWQQLAARDLDGLVATLSDLDFVNVAYPHSPGDVRRLWARAEELGASTVVAYRRVLDHPEQHPDHVWEVARLVTDAGHPAEAVGLHRYLVASYRGPAAAEPDRNAHIHRRFRGALLNLGAALRAQGELDGAITTLAEAVTASRGTEETTVLQYAAGNLGLCHLDQGRAAEAVPLLEEALSLARTSGEASGLQAALGNLAGVRRAVGDLAGALALYDEQEAVCRSVGDGQDLGLALAGSAVVHADTGDPLAALAGFERWRTAAREAGDLSSQVEALVGESGTLRQVGRFAEAEARAKDAEGLARRLSDEPLLARVLDGRARLAIDQGRWEDARQLAAEASLTARSSGVLPPLLLSLGALGIAQLQLGDVTGSAATHTEELEVATRLGDPVPAAVAQVNLAAVDLTRQDLGSALGRYASAEPVLRSRGLAAGLVPLLNNRWQIHASLGDHVAAIADLIDCGAQCAASGAREQRVQVLTKAAELLYQTGRTAEAEPVWASLAEACAVIQDDAGLQRAVGERALLLLGRGERDEARRLLDQQEEICRRTGDQVGLAACVGNRALLLQQEGDLGGSLECLDEQLALSRATGNGQGVLFATANRGEVLGNLGRTAEARTALVEARAMAVQWNLAPMVQQLDQMLSRLG